MVQTSQKSMEQQVNSHQDPPIRECPLPSPERSQAQHAAPDASIQTSCSESSTSPASPILRHKMRYVVFDTVHEPFRVRRRPGRKSHPAAKEIRKEQNREAQRALRARKQRDLCNLHDIIRTLREERDSLTKELEKQKEEYEILKAEKWYLRGIALSLHFLCLQEKVRIPAHSPYFPLETLAGMAKTAPEAIDSYINACIRNNLSLDPTMGTHDPRPTKNPRAAASLNDPRKQCNASMNEQGVNDKKTRSAGPTAPRVNGKATVPSGSTELEDEEKSENKQNTSLVKPQFSSMAFIQWARLQLRIGYVFSGENFPKCIMQQTFIQNKVPHDARINSLPALARDRPILYRDMIDLDKYIEALITDHVFCGGDPLDLKNWQIK
ncbi:hypothetical protein EC973_004107 [Apophysomyces ossiformis]|uniref:BZIP domain-containing protein n=1 Tax=Apophysomyces ossiformis TaxID=679940 RepID=A0A8H7ELN1_9FUNG|nr:hypothetical protein EC973_004107 [Apophysomyces ossiformis]